MDLVESQEEAKKSTHVQKNNYAVWPPVPKLKKNLIILKKTETELKIKLEKEDISHNL